MRFGLIIAGIVVAGVGLAAYLGKLEYQKTDTLVQIGDLKAEVKHDQTIPPWASLLIMVIGGGMVLAGVARKT